KGTLTTGMNSIRNSVHDLHENSVDLFTQLGKLVTDFAFCPITFDYDVGEIKAIAVTYAIIAIVKEALANIMRHSNASQATLTVREHPGLYQVIIADNGTLKGIDYDKGMGLNNIRVRVESLNGIFNIDCHSGFRLFVSIPKEVKK
ncbi:MAG TPA: sensor histidine kinase, partial [Thermotogota bacterium]|nr:sensor histidine kinase [Thermotogota bacterium]